MSNGLEIVPYEERHRDAVRNICLRTGFLGEDLRPRLPHPELFLDLATQYYLTKGRKGVFIAQRNGITEGYVFTVLDAGKASRFDRAYFPGRIIRELSRLGEKTAADRKYYFAWLRALMRLEFRTPPTPGFPSTLHINVPLEFQGRGAGVALMQKGLSHLTQQGSPGLHLHTTTANKKMTSFLRALGFRELFSRPARLYADFGVKGISYVVYGKELN